MPSTRFIDPGIGLGDLSTHFVVHCPKCEVKAWIKPAITGYKLTCSACFHIEQQGHWYGASIAYVSVACRKCYAPLQRNFPSNGVRAQCAMHCNNCGDDGLYEPQIIRNWVKDGLMCDPVFGLPLWLQDTIRGDIFWAYHYEHLDLLSAYITAKHRERGISSLNSIRKNSAMFSRLPSFITKARNRSDLLQIINQLKLK
jgi:hypothetical protein